ncbi:MAG: alpha/beta fold hydrolase [Janthinobacterium lividum]
MTIFIPKPEKQQFYRPSADERVDPLLQCAQQGKVVRKVAGDMLYIENNGVRIAYTDIGQVGKPPILLLHGLSLDSTSLAAQASYLSNTHRTIVPDLRGHGDSDAPLSSYEVPVFARDLKALCDHLGVTRLVVVGHSMGGNIALSLAQLYPALVSAVCFIDSALFMPEATKQIFAAQCEEAGRTGGMITLCRTVLHSLCLPEESLSQRLIEASKVPEYVIASAMPAHTVGFDSHSVARGCTVPLAYIHSGMPFVDLDALRSACPQIRTAATLGAGHLSPLEVPDQINAMLSRFLALISSKENPS